MIESDSSTAATWSGEVAGTVHWDYDNDLRIVNETVNGAFGAAFGYDADSLMTSAGALARTLDPQNGRLTGTTLGAVSDSYGYDEYGALASYQAGSLLGVQYTRDALGRITAKQETVEGVTHLHEYAYDLRGRLVEEKKDGGAVGQWVYDGNGNRVADTVAGRTGTYDAQDRMLTCGGASYTYGANGELLAKSDSGLTTTYTYDGLGNLMRVALPDVRVIEYLVDGLGRRVGKKVDGVLVKGWVYRSQLQPVAELDGAGNVVARYVHTTRVNVPDYMIKGGNTYRFIHDHLGSVRLVVDAATGVVVQRLDYDAWGRVLTDTNPGFQPFGFAGGLYDPDTGLVRFGARDYDAETGRWTSPAPIRFEGGDWNLYAYVGSNPVSFADYRGFSKYDKLWGLPQKFWKWFHKNVKMPGGPDLTKDEAKALCGEGEEMGKPGPDKKGPKGAGGDGGNFGPDDFIDFMIPFPPVVMCVLSGTCGGSPNES